MALVLCLGCLSACSARKEPSGSSAENAVPPTAAAPSAEVPTADTSTTEVPTAEAPTTEGPTTEAPTEETPAVPVLSGCAVMHELEFGGVYIDMTIDDFNALGFRYGDSVDVTFSNGYKLEDLPYYNGYYTRTGDPLLVAYPGYPHIKAGINNGDDLWVIAGLNESDTAEITLHEEGKFANIQDARDIHYKDDRDQFPSDAVFANFRAASVSGLAADTLFRSASPCDNQHKRAPYVDALCREAGIRFILDLADTEEKISGYIAKDDFNSPYFLTVRDAGHVCPIALNTNFTSEGFRAKLAAGLTAMAGQEGPYLVHCTEGKDRTGFVCLLLEALCGASYEEIVEDYMITYDNYYQITKKETLLGASLSSFCSYYGLDTEMLNGSSARYAVIVENVLDPMVALLAEDGADLDKADLAAGAAAYLKDCGMSAEQIDLLRAKLNGH